MTALNAWVTGSLPRPATIAEVDDFETTCPDSDAYLSADGVYRYRLWRHWGDGCMGVVTFLMLNPSTADGHVDDPTIRKCVGFARRWRCHGIRVVNLFALRSAKPRGLLDHVDPFGQDNDEHLRAVLRQRRASDTPADLIVCAWGSCGNAAVKRLVRTRLDDLRDRDVFGRRELHCLGRAEDGSPRHPLMLAYETPLEPWRSP